MRDMCERISALVENGDDMVLATILNKSGSAPREEGTKMLIKKDFSIIGTIGGGLLEAMTIKLSAKVFANQKHIIEEFNLSNKEASSLGMVCGGDVKVLLEYIDYKDTQMIKVYQKANDLKTNRVDFVMITRLSDDQRDVKWICTVGELYGSEDEKAQNIAKIIREDFNNIKIQELLLENERFLIEPTFNFESVCIIGAGHVAQKIADLTKNLGFYTVVIDDRETFANTERFPTADEVKVIPAFNNLQDYVIIDHNSYIIIVTRGHAYDKEVLAQMLKTEAKYIGMIGSRSKRESTYNCLLNEGFTLKDLERVYCPIGLNIYADTPEEIAISIAAELIKVKRGPGHDKK